MTGPIDYRLLIKIDFKICDWSAVLCDWPQVSSRLNHISNVSHGARNVSQLTDDIFYN